jgi:hypothetical protein
LDPFSCSKAKCNAAKPAIAKGKKKCRLNNLFNVGLSTENPPHNHCTIEGPTLGIADTRFVITVAPQKLI